MEMDSLSDPSGIVLLMALIVPSNAILRIILCVVSIEDAFFSLKNY